MELISASNVQTRMTSLLTTCPSQWESSLVRAYREEKVTRKDVFFESFLAALGRRDSLRSGESKSSFAGVVAAEVQSVSRLDASLKPVLCVRATSVCDSWCTFRMQNSEDSPDGSQKESAWQGATKKPGKRLLPGLRSIATLRNSTVFSMRFEQDALRARRASSLEEVQGSRIGCSRWAGCVSRSFLSALASS